jgi:hypothetical protein
MTKKKTLTTLYYKIQPEDILWFSKVDEYFMSIEFKGIKEFIKVSSEVTVLSDLGDLAILEHKNMDLGNILSPRPRPLPHRPLLKERHPDSYFTLFDKEGHQLTRKEGAGRYYCAFKYVDEIPHCNTRVPYQCFQSSLLLGIPYTVRQEDHGECLPLHEPTSRFHIAVDSLGVLNDCTRFKKVHGNNSLLNTYGIIWYSEITGELFLAREEKQLFGG